MWSRRRRFHSALGLSQPYTRYFYLLLSPAWYLDINCSRYLISQWLMTSPNRNKRFFTNSSVCIIGWKSRENRVDFQLRVSQHTPKKLLTTSYIECIIYCTFMIKWLMILAYTVHTHHSISIGINCASQGTLIITSINGLFCAIWRCSV